MVAPNVSQVGARQNDADSTTNWSAGNLDTDAEKQGTGCVGAKSGTGISRYYHQDGTSRNFASGQTNDGDHIYVWMNVLTPTQDTLTNGGLRIYCGDAGTNAGEWYVGGDGTVAGDPYSLGGGWFKFVTDPASDFDNIVGGTWTTTGNPAQLTAVVDFGGSFNLTANIMGNFNNALVDAIDVQSGLRLEDGDGTTAGTFQEFVDADTGTKNNNYGIARLISGVFFIKGKLLIGHDTGSSSTLFEDDGQLVVFENANVSDTLYEFFVEDNSGTATTDVTLGLLNGGITSSGCTLRAAGTREFLLNIDLSNASSSFNAYACIFQRMRLLTITNGASVTTFQDCNFVNSGQVDGGPTYSGCNFLGGTDTVALQIDATSELDNVTDSLFANNNRAIEFTVAGTYTANNLLFAGNTVDIRNSVNATTADSYSDTNQNATQALGNGTIVGCGQSFTNGSAGTLSNVRWHLSKTGSPTGNAVAKLYAINNTIGGGDDVPTGTALATSDNVDVSALTGTLTLTQFNFSDEYSMSASTDYVVTIEYSGGDGSNFVNVGTDTSAPTATGNFATLTGSTWSAVSGTDAIFFVSRGGVVKINLTNGSNPTTYENTGSPPGATILSQSVTVEINGLTEGSRVLVQGSGGDADGEIIVEGYANSSGIVSGTFGGTTPQSVIIRARNGGIINAAIQDDGGAFTDFTADARTTTGSPGIGSTNDVDLTPVTPAVSDAFYFGGIAIFEEICLNITTAGSGYTGSWDYWNGSWTSFTVDSDTTSSFQTSGKGKVIFTAPNDWATTSVNSQGPFYYVRFTVDSIGSPTQARADSITLNQTAKYLPFQSTGTITSSGLTVTAVWIEDTINP